MSKLAIFLLVKSLFLFTVSCTQNTADIVHSPAIEGLTKSDLYKVVVNGQDVWSEKFRTNMDIESLPDWFTDTEYTSIQQEIHFTGFASKGPLKITIEVPESISQAQIRPSSRGITADISGNTLSFSLPGPDKLYIEIDDLPPLCLFADHPETDVPSIDDDKVIYFEPGLHHAGYITPRDNQTIYIAPGAIVYGGLRINGVSNVNVTGRGILDGGFEHRRMVTVDDSKNINFNGITIRNGISWINTITNSSDVVYDNIKVISFGPSGDGINPVGSHNITISNCFFRCTDDCIAIKAPKEDHIVKDILIKDNTMIGFAFSDGVTIGFETRGPSISNVVVTNNDILLARGGSRVDGHSGFSIVCDGPSVISNILFEGIRVEQADEKLFELIITEGQRYGNDLPGHIRDVTIRNVSWFHEGPISLIGFSNKNRIAGVVFENCYIDNQPLNQVKDRILEINDYVDDLKIIN